MINPVFQGKERNCKVTEKMVKIQNVDLVIISSSKYEICRCISLEFELFRRISVPYRHIKVSRSLKFNWKDLIFNLINEVQGILEDGS